jgi:hypothetical protein
VVPTALSVFFFSQISVFVIFFSLIYQFLSSLSRKSRETERAIEREEQRGGRDEDLCENPKGNKLRDRGKAPG